jgi:hypothetical protein
VRIPFLGTKIFALVTLTLLNDILTENFKLDKSSVVDIGVLTFNISELFDKTFTWVPKI